jgi:tetraacyldisaccharide 4'-kinase
MIFLRKILFPISILYWLITFLRNWCYDIGLFKSQSYEIPIIAVGNLSVGGTGKTPHIEYLIRLLSNYKIATLSRGYKRRSKGFVLADATTNAAILGDEPFQFYSKFPNVAVAVDADRRNGIAQLQEKVNPDVILLDDAFQHRKVKAGFYILLTTFNDLFVDDYILPFGNLREPAFGKKRANLIIVTKCPTDLSELAQENIRKRLKTNLPVYFSTIVYDDFVYNENGKLEVNALVNPKVILAGIANPSLFFNHLKQRTRYDFSFSRSSRFFGS